MLLVVTACGGGGGSAGEQRVDPSSSGRPDLRPAGIPDQVLRLEVRGRPIGLAVEDDEVLVALAEAGRLARVRIDGEGGDVTASTRVGDIPLRVVADAGTTWVSIFGEGSVVRLEGGRATRWTEVAREPEGLALWRGALWVVDQAADRVVAVDPGSGDVRRRVGVGAAPRLTAAGARALWVTSYGDGTLTRVTARGARTSARLCTGPQGVVQSGELVWVACTSSEELVAVDPATLAVRRRLPAPGGPHAVVDTAAGVVAVTAEGPGLISVGRAGGPVSTCSLGELPAPLDGNVDAVAVPSGLVVSSPLDDALLHVPQDLVVDGC